MSFDQWKEDSAVPGEACSMQHAVGNWQLAIGNWQSIMSKMEYTGTGPNAMPWPIFVFT
jgi:hypothetical protein